jgi:hypothetical protein
LLVCVFLIFEEICFVFVGILFPLEDASQVRTQAVLAEHVEDVQQVRGIEDSPLYPSLTPRMYNLALSSPFDSLT